MPGPRRQDHLPDSQLRRKRKQVGLRCDREFDAAIQRRSREEAANHRALATSAAANRVVSTNCVSGWDKQARWLNEIHLTHPLTRMVLTSSLPFAVLYNLSRHDHTASMLKSRAPGRAGWRCRVEKTADRGSADTFAHPNDCGRATDLRHRTRRWSPRYAADVCGSREADAGDDEHGRTLAGRGYLADFARAVSRTPHGPAQSCDPRYRRARNALESNAPGNRPAAGAQSVFAIGATLRAAAGE